MRRWLPILFLLACGKPSKQADVIRENQVQLEEEEQEQEESKEKKPLEAPFYQASIDDCLIGRHCLDKAQFVDDERVKLVKLFTSSVVYEDLDTAYLREEDRESLEGAALVTAKANISKALTEAADLGFKIPSSVHVDPLCSLSLAANNAFFIPVHGFGDRALSPVICLGYQFHDESLYPLALDEFVSTHELFHVLFHESLVGHDKKIPADSLMYSHELDAFNEGSADFFAQVLTESSLNRLFRSLLPWRVQGRRTDLQFHKGHHGHVYKDGMAWTELFEELHFRMDAMPILACSLDGLAKKLRDAKAEAHRLDLEADHIRDSQLLEFNMWDYSYNIWQKDILHAVKQCTPEDQHGLFDELAARYFPAVHEIKDPAISAEMALVMVPNRKALCKLQKDYQLGPFNLRRYEYADACENTFSFEWAEGDFKMAEDVMPSRGDAVFVIPAIKLDGEARACTLRGSSAPEFSYIQLFDARPYLIGTMAKKFSHMIFRNTRGSWYRDVPLGSFPDNPSYYRLDGPLGFLADKGFRMFPRPTIDGLPSQPLSGFFWSTTGRYHEQSKPREQFLEWGRFAFLPYLVSLGPTPACRNNPGLCDYRITRPVGEKCHSPLENCEKTANYFIECESHRSAKSAEKPLGDLDKVWIAKVKSYIYHCEGEYQCELRSY